MSFGFKPPVDSKGKHLIYLAPFAATGDMYFRGTGFSGTITAGQENDIDLQISNIRFMNAAQLICKDHTFGDTLTYQVVDKDNVLGMGAGTVLDEFATDWNLAEDKQDQGVVLIPYPAKILAGLYIRIKYKSTGQTDVKVRCNVYLHEKIA